MGMFDYVTLSPQMRNMVQQCAPEKEITPDGWQSKDFSCRLNTITLEMNQVTIKEHDGDCLYENLSREVTFYKNVGDRAKGDWEWLQFVVVYRNGKLDHIRDESHK